MAKGVNKVILMGNLGRDPDIRSTNVEGRKIAKFSVATTDYWKNKDSGEGNERTEWHNVVCFEPLAKVVEKYLSRGSRVFIEGKLRTRKWVDNNGNDRYTTEIICSDLVMAGGESSGKSSNRSQEGDDPSLHVEDDVPW